MAGSSNEARIVKLAVTVRVQIPDVDGQASLHGTQTDLSLEVAPDVTVRDLTEAVVIHLGLEPDDDHRLLRRMTSWNPTSGVPESAGFLPRDLLLSECGLFDGAMLYLRSASSHPSPELSIDTERAEDDLYLIDERGTHRGRVTRLPRGVEVVIGSSPVGSRRLVVDDDRVPRTLLTLLNVDGSQAQCVVHEDAGVYISGTPTSAEQKGVLLPGGTVNIRRSGTDFVGFALTTRSGLRQRPALGKIRFDPAARLADPVYPTLPEMLTRLDSQPSLPEHQPFPSEQIVVPLAMVAALWIATRSALSLLIAPIAAVIPIVNYFRQQRMAKNRYDEARKDWVDKLEQISDEHTKVAGIEEGNLREENPTTDVWARRGYRRLAGLWNRTADRPDFLRVSLGYGQLPSRYELKLAEGVDQDDEDFKRLMQVEGRIIDRDRVRPQLFNVPITVSMREHHLGIVGPSALVSQLATGVLLQAVCGHAPGGLGLAALLPSSEVVREGYDWLKWLPHTLAGSTLLPAARIFAGRDSCNRFLISMRDLHLERHKYRLDEAADSFALLVVHEAAEVDIALLDEICSLSNGQIRVLWLGSSADTTPQLITSVVQLSEDRKDSQDSTGVILSGDPALVGNRFALSLFRTAPTKSARALAPLYDPRASGANAGIPQRLPLAAVTPVVGLQYPNLPRIEIGRSLPVPLGVCEPGIFELDLVKDGPHTLIGGTTGSGKSELLQAMTSGLVGRYSPAEVSLFLVDFKGGATFAPFANLPHVVGYVSDLDQRNVNRALAFLRAELRRRERAFEEMRHAKEYGEYLQRALRAGKEDVLPRLVVIFDEFATIVQEFERSTMPAVIDIAQRGRSWGVHLVLATQQPTRDVVVPKVRANVNARIALRTLSPDDSQTIIDRPDATRIPRALPGRALACLEGNNIVEFQGAFAGAPYVEADASSRVRVEQFKIHPEEEAAPSESNSGEEPERDGQEPQTHLERLLVAVDSLQCRRSRGARTMPLPLEAEPRRARRPGLDQYGGRHEVKAGYDVNPIIVGLTDLPHQQTQRQVEVDLQRGGICIGGPNGSGRTTALLTTATEFAAASVDHETFGIVCFDAADNLSTELRKRMGDVTSVALARSEHVTRAIDQLWLIMRSRMADDIATEAAIAYTASSPILMVIDGFDVLGRMLSAPGLTPWYTRLVDLLGQGRRYGIFAAIASRHLRDLDLTMLSSMAWTFELHAHYEEAGVSQEDRLPGFATDPIGHLVQFYQPDIETGWRARVDSDLAAFLRPDGWREPAQIRRAGLPVSHASLVIGCDEVSMTALAVDIADSHVLIVGASRSGRSELLLEFGRQVVDRSSGKVALFRPRPSNNGEMPDYAAVFTSEHIFALADAPSETERRSLVADLGFTTLEDGRLVVLVDDCFAIEPLEDGSSIEARLAQLHQQSHIQVIAVTTAQAASRSPLSAAMRSSGTTVYLRPGGVASDTDDGWRVRGVSFQHRPGLVYRAGDALVQTDLGQHMVHLVTSAAVI